MLVALINYMHTQNSIELKHSINKYSETIIIDSGSILSDDQNKHIDIPLSNVYYCGMLNALHDFISEQKHKGIIYVIASDVKINNIESLIHNCEQAFEDPKVGVYAPSVKSKGSPHPQMINKNSSRVRKAVFVDGYCFALKSELLHELCPIDVKTNYIGWGIDVYLSFLAAKNQLLTVVDDRVIVEHSPSENQEFRTKARTQRNNWYKTLEPKARRYRSWTAIEFLKNEFGAGLINRFSWN